jgi:predicted alpha/beta superfamily hydrolase
MSDIRILHDFYSYPEGTKRTLRIYTPALYSLEPERRFPVLYMMDGQNVFSHPESAIYHTWCANTTMDQLILEGRIRPWIIVAVDHLARCCCRSRRARMAVRRFFDQSPEAVR